MKEVYKVSFKSNLNLNVPFSPFRDKCNKEKRTIVFAMLKLFETFGKCGSFQGQNSTNHQRLKKEKNLEAYEVLRLGSYL